MNRYLTEFTGTFFLVFFITSVVTLYVATDGGVFTSTDEGACWEAGSGLTDPRVTAIAAGGYLVVCASRQAILAAWPGREMFCKRRLSRTNGPRMTFTSGPIWLGYYRSTNGGQTWTQTYQNTSATVAWIGVS